MTDNTPRDRVVRYLKTHSRRSIPGTITLDARGTVSGDQALYASDIGDLLAENADAVVRAKKAQELAEAAAALLDRDTETEGNAEQPYYNNVSAALAAFRAALGEGTA